MARAKAARPSEVTLKPVGISPQGDAILLARRAEAKSGGFRLQIDEALVARLEEARRRLTADTSPGSTDGSADEAETSAAVEEVPPAIERGPLSVREIQALLREGFDARTIAESSGMDVAWVARFEGPISWERVGIIARTQKASVAHPIKGTSGKSLHESLVANLSDRMSEDEIREASSWDCTRPRSSAMWMVTLEILSTADGVITARFEFDPSCAKLRALDDVGLELGWVPPDPGDEGP